MRCIGALVSSGTLVILLSACPPMQPSGPQERTCLSSQECRTGQRCLKGTNMVLGYCRGPEPQPGAEVSDGGAAVDAGVDVAPAPGDISL